MRMTNKDLKALFLIFNDRFFNSEIKENYSVRFGDKEECDDAEGLCTDDEIFINEDFKSHPDMAILVLGHEMSHAVIRKRGYRGHDDDGHSILFHAEIDRLYKAGFYEGLL